MISSVLLLLVSGSVAAADTLAPVVDTPEDTPGADVIVFLGDVYTLDVSGSTDDVGIVNYMFEFEDAGAPVSLWSTTGKVDYTFTAYGQTWVTVHAWDRAGNEGLGYFSIDIVERITTDSIIDGQTGTLGHSLYFDDADLTIQDSTLFVPDGVGKSPGGGGGGGVPDLLSESLNPDGDLSGWWAPYSWNTYWRNSNPYYGEPSFDTEFKLSGEGAIKVADGYQHRGFEYHFDTNADLTGYNALSFWIHRNYPSYYNYIYYVYFYGSHDYISTYGYTLLRAGCMYQGGYSAYRGWHGYTIPLDPVNTGYWNSYRMTDLSSVACIRFYYYTAYNYYYNGYDMWIDNVALYVREWGDEITESTSPSSGSYAGRWSGPSTTLTGDSYVGDYGVRFTCYRGSRYNIYYYFDKPVDLSAFNAMRFFLKVTQTNGRYINYMYYWPYTSYYNLYIYDSMGRYCAYYSYPYTYTYYAYAYSYNTPWYAHSMPWGAGSAWTNTGVDFTQISYFRLANFGYTSYSYPSASPCYFIIDGLEWLGTGSAGSPVDTVPMAIYVDGGDLTVDGSRIVGSGKIGARLVNYGGTTTLQGSTFDNIWHTEYSGAGNMMDCFGGVEAYGDAVIDHVAFTNCKGPGLALFDGNHQVDKDTTDLSGAAMKVRGAPKVITGVTERSTGAVNMDVSGWWCEASPTGTGIMVMVHDTTATVTVDIHDNHVDNNKVAGIVISNMGNIHASPFQQGGIGNLDVTIRDQLIEDAGEYGIYYYIGHGAWAPGTVPKLLVDNVTVRSAGLDGLMVHLDMGAANLNATIMNSSFERNYGSGIATMFSGFFGKAEMLLDDVVSIGNSENGLEFESDMGPWNDGKGNVISPVSEVDVYINSSRFTENQGWGLMEHFNAEERTEGGVNPPWTWSGPTRTTLMFNLTMTLSGIEANQGGGYLSLSDDGWIQGNYWMNRYISDTDIMENRGSGVYVLPNHDMWGGGGTVKDVFMFDTCRITDNVNAVLHDLGYNNYGYYSEIYLQDCNLQNQDSESIVVFSPWTTDGVHYWGLSQVLGTLIYVDGCRINNVAYFELLGADDSGHPSWDASMGLVFTNNVVDIEDEDIIFLMGAYPSCDDFLAYGEIGKNRFFRGFVGDGLKLEMYGGWNLEMDMVLCDLKIDRPGGSGINITAGTLTTSPEPHQIYGTVMVDNVTVTNAVSNGINFTVDHALTIGGKSLAVLEVHDMTMDGVDLGIRAQEVTGQIHSTYITNTRSYAVDLQFCLFDFYSCDVGPVTTENIKVMTKGAARMWFDVDVDVKWASGQYVMGAVVSVQDNTFATIGVDTVDAAEPLSLGFINSYTILPDSVYSKSPFIVSATYLGLETEKAVDVDRDIVVDLVLVDDVAPRLTVNSPMDGSSQTKTQLEIRGYAWDMHSGLESVFVSIDGIDWFEAEGSPEFAYTMEVPEGQLVLMVKATDFAGNERMELVAVLVDATAPTILIIEPRNDEIYTQDPMLYVIGVTELGATVKVNNEPVTMEYTLFQTMVTLNEGYNEVRVTARDPLGNTAVHVIKATLDSIPPPLIVTEPRLNAVVGVTRVTVTGQTEASAMVYINGIVVANIDGEFSTRVTLGEGNNVIEVMAKDAVGNQRTVKVPITVDTSEPWLRLASPNSGDVFGPAGILVKGWVEAGSTVLVNDRQVAVANGYFMTTVIGSEGPNTIVVEVIDQAGNTLKKTVDVAVDTTAPRVRLDSPEDGTITPEDEIEVSGRLTWDPPMETFRDIILLVNGEFMPFAENGEFRVMYDLSEGTNPLLIRVEDAIGNANTMSLTVVRDTTAPFLLADATPTFNHPVWNKPATYKAMVYIEGLTEPDAMVMVDGSEVTVDEEGYFNVSLLLDSVPDDLELIQRTVVVVATDAAGNSKETTLDIYRLKKEETEKGFGDYEDTQYYVLFLSIVILVLAILFTAIMWQRLGRPREGMAPEEMYKEEV